MKALPRDESGAFYVQRLRDEAHRWAIGAHRAKRAKAFSLTPLDDIPGIGAKRERGLAGAFQYAKAVPQGPAFTQSDGGAGDIGGYGRGYFGFFNAKG